MTEAYRTRELENARKEFAAARTAYLCETNNNSRQKREKAEAVEFWGSKVSFLSHVKGG